MKKLWSLLLICSATTVALADDLPTLTIPRLEGDAQILGWQPALGEGLAEMLVTEVNRLNKFKVLESSALNELVSEVKLGEAGYVGDGEKVQKGGFKGSDFMLIGKVSRFGSNKQGVNLGGFGGRGLGNLGVGVTTSDVRIDWRLVDSFTREVIKSDSAAGQKKGATFDTSIAINGAGGNIGFSNQEFMNSALGKATAQAVTNVAASLAMLTVPESGRHRNKAVSEAKQQADAKKAVETLKQTAGKVLAVVNKTTLIVSLGSTHGFKMGDKLALYQSNDIKDDKGNVVFSEDKLVGEVTLETVQEDRSKAVYSGDAEAKSGWTVKSK
jgi:curli biogenesis system outer membrane secretion channel CsgG